MAVDVENTMRTTICLTRDHLQTFRHSPTQDYLSLFSMTALMAVIVIMTVTSYLEYYELNLYDIVENQPLVMNYIPQDDREMFGLGKPEQHVAVGPDGKMISKAAKKDK